MIRRTPVFFFGPITDTDVLRALGFEPVATCRSEDRPQRGRAGGGAGPVDRVGGVLVNLADDEIARLRATSTPPPARAEVMLIDLADGRQMAAVVCLQVAAVVTGAAAPPPADLVCARALARLRSPLGLPADW
jgi:hypothetical protein